MNESNNINRIIQIIESLSPTRTVLEVLLEHKCIYLAHQLATTTSNTCITEIVEQNMRRTNALYAQCENLFSFLNENIEYAVMKGAVLSQRAYGNIGYRKSGDIDILIDAKDIAAIEKYLLSNGFIRGKVCHGEIKPYSREQIMFHAMQSHQVAPFAKRTNDPIANIICIDINFTLFWGEHPTHEWTSEFLIDTQKEIINGIHINRLQTEKEFIALCLHHYKDMNSTYLISRGKYNLSLFSDIYFFINRNSIDLDHLITLCQSMGIMSYMYYCLFYTNILFGGSIAQKLVDLFYDSSYADTINSFGLTETRYSWPIPFPERLFLPNTNVDFLISDTDKKRLDANRKYL